MWQSLKWTLKNEIMKMTAQTWQMALGQSKGEQTGKSGQRKGNSSKPSQNNTGIVTTAKPQCEQGVYKPFERSEIILKLQCARVYSKWMFMTIIWNISVSQDWF